MVHAQAYDGRRVGSRDKNLRKEERNKWGFLQAIAERGKPFMP
jgi:hypothetical protein